MSANDSFQPFARSAPWILLGAMSMGLVCMATKDRTPGGPTAAEREAVERVRKEQAHLLGAQQAALAQAQEEEQREQAARRAQQEHEARVNRLVSQAHSDVVDRAYQGGRNIDWDIKDWKFNGYKNQYTVTLYLSWSGSITGDLHQAQGLFRATVDDSNQFTWSWEPTWTNENLANYLRNRQDAAGVFAGLVILNEVAKALNDN